jgi:uncharacterized protein
VASPSGEEAWSRDHAAGFATLPGMPSPAFASLLRAAAAIAAAYAALLALLWWGQETLIFMPTRLPAEHRFNVGSHVHEVFVDVPGARLNALHLRLPQSRGVVFFLHGNAGSLQTWFVDLQIYRELGLDLFMLDYRGFGKSTGRITSEDQLMNDVAAAWQSIAPGYAGRPVVFLGRSLGTGLAARLAAQLPPPERPNLLLLVSPYESLLAMAAEHYPFVPGFLVRYPLRTDLALPQLDPERTRIVLVHGTADEVIDDRHSRALAAVQPGAQWLRIDGGGHNDLQGLPAYRQSIADALRQALARP